MCVVVVVVGGVTMVCVCAWRGIRVRFGVCQGHDGGGRGVCPSLVRACAARVCVPFCLVFSLGGPGCLLGGETFGLG